MDANNQLFPDEITIGEKYGPAMKISDPSEAQKYFERCVEHSMRTGAESREHAEATERSNIGYFSGYCSVETQKRVETLFDAVHPVFGPVDGPDEPKTLEEVLRLGMKLGSED